MPNEREQSRLNWCTLRGHGAHFACREDQNLSMSRRSTIAVNRGALLRSLSHGCKGEGAPRASHCDRIERETTHRLAVLQRFARRCDAADITCQTGEGGKRTGTAINRSDKRHYSAWLNRRPWTETCIAP